MAHIFSSLKSKADFISATGSSDWLAAILSDSRIVDGLLRCSQPTAHRVVTKVRGSMMVYNDS
jgi:hypothetical protein